MVVVDLLANPRRPRRFTEQQYFKSQAQMRELFADLPSALANSVEIARRCSVPMTLGKARLPQFPTPEGVGLDDYMRQLARAGLERRMLKLFPDETVRAGRREEYLHRLDYECDTVVQMGFSGYFLIVADFINWAKENGVPVGPGRGSGAGSLVAFAPTPDGWERLARGAETASLLPLLALLAAGILRFVYRSRRLTIDGILATVVVYVLIAIIFSRLYLLLLAADPQSFDLPVAMSERTAHLLQVDMLYYSLITQCSVGYGDILPASDAARMLAVIQAIVGQFYMAVVVAVFVGMYATQRRV